MMNADLIKMTEGPNYIWILRCSGNDNINYSRDYKMILDAPNDGIIPLVEVINPKLLGHFSSRFRHKYGEVWVDLPYYLAEIPNKHWENVGILRSRYISNPEKFFLDNKSLIDVPVVSGPLFMDFNFERDVYNSIKDDFNKIAVRIRVPKFETTPPMLTSLKNLVKDMRPDDVLLIDVFQISGVEGQVVTNIEKIINVARQYNIGTYILNAFETQNPNCHNYGPLFTTYFSTKGFGDFASDERYKAGAGRGAQTRIIRYYDDLAHTLRFFTEKTLKYDGARNLMIRSGFWVNTSNTQHRSICQVCTEVINNLHGKGHMYWKRFKMLHYLNCIFHKTIPLISSTRTPEDLDPDGYNTIIKYIGE